MHLTRKAGLKKNARAIVSTVSQELSDSNCLAFVATNIRLRRQSRVFQGSVSRIVWQTRTLDLDVKVKFTWLEI
ncbi:hypothetical protein Poly59_59420 [Rubripirellula reticaptiva]|uniref:Uncharacterized protein n=1 Tax=Rubripirellula reticaptiva TaxID=2528013 RepID=A0A5C6EDR2_9BACT|nr:hypothetical protein Poly59_59420 [Rubripirellula reticaptiva]